VPADRLSAAVYDAGALIAADRNDRRFWADHRVRLDSGVVPIVPAPVVAQVSRAPSQAQLRRLLRGCDVVPMTEQVAHEAGGLLAKARTSDVVDAFVAMVAVARRADVVTSDRQEIEELVRYAGGVGKVIDI
jgi:predicted nucleic acid-binding protein